MTLLVKVEVNHLLESSLDNQNATINSSVRVDFELLEFTLKGSLLEIKGYSTIKGIYAYTEDRIRKILLIRPRLDIENIRKKDEFIEEYIDMTDEEILQLYSYQIPLENYKMTELNIDKKDIELDSLSGFKEEIDLATLTKGKPLKEGEYDLYLIHEQLSDEDDNLKYIKVLPLSNAKEFITNGVITTELNYYSSKLNMKYKLIVDFDTYSKTVRFENKLLQSFNPRNFDEDGQQPENKYIAAIKRRLFKLSYILFSSLPINNKKISIASDSRSDLTGNLYFIYEEMYNQELDVRIKLLLSERIDNKKSFFQLIKTAYHFATSKIILIDDFYPLIYPLNIRKNTELVQAWHAAGAFKTFGFSRVGRPGGPSIHSRNHRNYTQALVSSEGVRSHYAEGFGVTIDKVIPTGVPRSDVFFDDVYKTHVKKTLYEKYPMLENKKVILFAPTFRGNGQGSAYFPFEILDLRKLYENLKDEYVFIFKIHPFVKNEFTIPYDMSEFFYDLSEFREVNDLLLVTDILITDYSSVAFEFGILNKPMLFFGFDVEQYIKDRDFYYDYFDFIPGPLVKTTDEIIQKIKNKDFELEKIEPFIKYFFGDSLGHASKNVVNDIIKPGLEDLEEDKEVKVKLDPPKSRIELFERSLEEEEGN